MIFWSPTEWWVLFLYCFCLLISQLSALQYRKMDFHEFCAATSNVHQLEGVERWEQHARYAYELFEKDGNRAIVIDELASVCHSSSSIPIINTSDFSPNIKVACSCAVSQELGLSPGVPIHTVLHDWIRHTDGKLSFLGFVKLLHGVSSRTHVKAQ